jgi:hypothetical protein
MTLPSRLILYSCAYATDGGTQLLLATDEDGRQHSVRLNQHALPVSNPEDDQIPGRLYFDDKLIPIRSQAEANVLTLLRSAEIASPGFVKERSPRPSPMLVIGQDIKDFLEQTPLEARLAMTKAVIEFVESDEYLRFAERLGRKV